MQRPGKIRFDYAPPSGLRIVADGSSLAIEDSDLRTVEKYPIQSTPFRLLLSDSVDLARDARIVGVESQEGTLAISLEDKSGDAAGTIRLVFDSGAELQLKQWLITDAQGLTTRVDVNDIVAGTQSRDRLFHLQGRASSHSIEVKARCFGRAKSGACVAPPKPSKIDGNQS